VKIRKFALLVSVVAVCLLLLTLQSRGYGASARDLLALVTTPVQSGVARAHRAAFAVWDTYFDWKNARAENRHLRDENQRLRVEALRVGETEDENRRLRRLLALQARLPLTTLSGEIIGRDWGGWIRSLSRRFRQGAFHFPLVLLVIVSMDPGTLLRAITSFKQDILVVLTSQ